MSTPLPILDAQHPWPGLFPYGEDAHAFFNGREQETTDLLRLVRRNTCTLFYGQSGLGKSSLLRAGLFPALRADGFLPIYIRLDFRNVNLGLREQAWGIFRSALNAAGIDGRAPRDDESFWAYFHAADVELWDSRNRLLTPVLVLDQFEEIVQASEERALQDRLAAFLDELAGLVENRIPATVTARLETDPDAVASIDFNAERFRCVVGFREDFLPALQDRFAAHRMDTQSRLRITKMVEAQAMAAVQKTGGALVDADVSQRIVGFVAGASGHTATRTLEIEPALLSVVCFELNNRRLASGEARISPNLLAGAQDQIIAEFYQRSLADQDEAVAVFIERELLTESGYRDSCAVEDAVQRHAIPIRSIQRLVERRVLRQEERFGVLRVELTHDVLAPVVRANRDKRQAAQAFEAERAREAARLRRTRRLLWIGGSLAAFASVLVVVFFNLFREANAEKARVIEAQSTLFLSRANASLENNIPAEPVQFLAKALSLNPHNQGAIARLANFASHRRFARLMWEKDFNFPGEGVGTVQVLGESAFAFHSAGGDLTTVSLRMTGEVPTLEESCAARVVSSSPQPPMRTFSYPAPAAAQPVGPGRIADVALDMPGSVSADSAHKDFLAFCAAGKKKGTKDKPIARQNVIGFEGTAGSALWMVAGSTTMRQALQSDIRALIDDANDLGLARRVVSSASGVSLMIVGEKGAGLYVRQTAAGLPSQYLSVARFVASSAAAAEQTIEWSAAFDNTGNHALVSSSAGTCELWDLAQRRKLWSHLCAAYGHQFVPGKPWVAVFNDRPFANGGRLPDGLIDFSLIDVRSGNRLATLSRTQAINHVAFSADGARVVVSAQDRSAVVYDLPALTPAGTVMLHEGAVVEAHFIAGTDRLVTAAFDGSARIWNWREGKLVGEPLVHPGPVLFARPVLGGTHVLSVADDRRLRLWRVASDSTGAANAATGLLLPTPSASGDSLAYVTATLDGAAVPGSTVMIAKVSTDPSSTGALRDTRTLFQAPGGVERLKFNASADLLAVAGHGAWLSVVRTSDGKETRRLALPGPARRMLFAANDKYLVVQCPDSALRIYDLATGREAGLAIKLDGALLDFGISADSRWLTAASSAQLQIADLRTGYPVANLAPGGVVAAAVHPSQPEAAFSTRGQLAMWRPRLNQQSQRRETKTATDMPLAERIDMEEGVVLTSKKLLVGLRYIDNGRSLAAFSVDGVAWTWDVATLRVGPALRHSNSIVALSASEDGRWLVTITLDGLVRVWEYRSGQLMADAIALADSERDFVIVGSGTWALVENGAGRYDTMMLGLGFPAHPAPWLVPTVASLASVELDKDVPSLAEGSMPAGTWWQAWLSYVATRNGVQAK